YNEFKEEHYRRIAYVNEHFTCGIPGWKTDRGMVYIKYGPPDRIDDYTYGSGYDRPAWEGGGQTKVFPTQYWEYRNIPGIGSDIELEFVDSTGSSLYTLEMDVNKKDILLHASSGGRTMAEQRGEANVADRVSGRMDAGDSTNPYYKLREKDRPFAKYELLANMSKPPEIKYKDLRSIVDTRIMYNLVPFQARVDYVKISEQQVLVPVTLRVLNGDISFKERSFGVSRGTVNIYGIVTTVSGNFVQEFEDDIVRDAKTDELKAIQQDHSSYQKLVLLAPGLYKLGLVVKDLESGRIGMQELRLNVPSYQPTQLNSSSMIIARQVQKITDPDSDIGQFVLGDVKIIPEFEKRFQVRDPMWVYMQVYSMGIDQNRLQPDIELEYVVERDGTEFVRFQDLAGETFKFVSGDRIVITGRLPLQRFIPGQYTLRIRVHDRISGQDMERTERFEVTS
ncbi:MAG TPA: GWxTD domain-containing protein, partial [Acidobacteriota bacterium]|nr:GWxTD domain-containing protein [Acidobacteriota bacterium]